MPLPACRAARVSRSVLAGVAANTRTRQVLVHEPIGSRQGLLAASSRSLVSLSTFARSTTNADDHKELIGSIDLLSLTATRAVCMNYCLPGDRQPAPKRAAAIPRVRIHFRSLPMSLIKLSGRGWLVPTRLTGVAYQVRYGIHIAQQIRQRDRYFGRFLRRTRPTKRSLCSAHARRIPDGNYFLHADDGRVHWLKHSGDRWHCVTVGG